MDRTTSSRCLDQIVEHARRLYTLPGVAAQVIELTENDTVDLRGLKQCVENDPALCAKILRVVNSSLFGLSRQVSDLGQALALMGTKPLKLLVLGFSLPSKLFSELAQDVLAFYWRTTLTKAVAAREISQRVWRQEGDEPFIAGLLQDLGILVLLQDIGSPYVEFLKTVTRDGQDLRCLEIATFGFDHTVVSAKLLQHWQFPEHVVQAVGMPHDVDRINSLPIEQRKLPQTLHLADLLSQLLACERTEILPTLLDVAGSYCQLTAEQLESLVADLHDTVEQLASVLSLDLPGDLSYTELLRRAQAQLSEVAEAAACEEVSLKAEDPSLSQVTRQLATAVQQGGSQYVEPSNPEAASTCTADPSQAVLDDVGLVGRVAAALSVCRQSRGPLSLMMIAMDDYVDLLATRGADSVQSMVRLIETAARALCRDRGDCLHIGDGQFLVILQNVERAKAVDNGRRLVRGMHQWSKGRSRTGLSAVTISVGVATLGQAPKNFPARELIDAASRCVFAAQASGGDVIKSITVY